MSFSTDVKKTICKTEYECPGCRLCELSGFFSFIGRMSEDDIKYSVAVTDTAKRIERALYDELGIVCEREGKHYVIRGEDYRRLMTEISCDSCIYECCKVAYIRGAFMGGGSVNAPDKKYHLEFSTRIEEQAKRLISILKEFDFRPKLTVRKDKFVVYIKEGSQISDLLGYITDAMAGLEFLSAQVEKEYTSSTQRLVNCDNANLNKLAKASSRHIVAIKKIKAARRWSQLPEVLREIGELRLKHPEASLEALGTMTEQKIGKSGVNHRLNRIVEYSEGLGKD